MPWEDPLVPYDKLTDIYSYHPTTTVTGTSTTWIDASKVISMTSIPTFATDTELSKAREELNNRIDVLEHQSIEHKNKIELHIDKLEEDIEYFEDKRRESEDEILELKTKLETMQDYIDIQRSTIEKLNTLIIKYEEVKDKC